MSFKFFPKISIYSILFVLINFVLLISCNNNPEEENNVSKNEKENLDTLELHIDTIETEIEVDRSHEIINKLSLNYNLKTLDNTTASFYVNDRLHEITNDKNQTTFTYTDSNGLKVTDHFKSNTLTRTIGKDTISLSKEEIENAINQIKNTSDRVFILNQLKHSSFTHTFISRAIVNEQPYFKILSNKQNVKYIFWIHEEDYNVDYFAEKKPTSLMLFYEISNRQFLGDIIIQDYKVYKPVSENINFMTIDELFNNQELVRVRNLDLSQITLETN